MTDKNSPLGSTNIDGWDDQSLSLLANSLANDYALQYIYAQSQEALESLKQERVSVVDGKMTEEEFFDRNNALLNPVETMSEICSNNASIDDSEAKIIFRSIWERFVSFIDRPVSVDKIRRVKEDIDTIRTNIESNVSTQAPPPNMSAPELKEWTLSKRIYGRYGNPSSPQYAIRKATAHEVSNLVHRMPKDSTVNPPVLKNSILHPFKAAKAFFKKAGRVLRDRSLASYNLEAFSPDKTDPDYVPGKHLGEGFAEKQTVVSTIQPELDQLEQEIIELGEKITTQLGKIARVKTELRTIRGARAAVDNADIAIKESLDSLAESGNAYGPKAPSKGLSPLQAFITTPSKSSVKRKMKKIFNNQTKLFAAIKHMEEETAKLKAKLPLVDTDPITNNTNSEDYFVEGEHKASDHNYEVLTKRMVQINKKRNRLFLKRDQYKGDLFKVEEYLEEQEDKLAEGLAKNQKDFKKKQETDTSKRAEAKKWEKNLSNEMERVFWHSFGARIDTIRSMQKGFKRSTKKAANSSEKARKGIVSAYLKLREEIQEFDRKYEIGGLDQLLVRELGEIGEYHSLQAAKQLLAVRQQMHTQKHSFLFEDLRVRGKSVSSPPPPVAPPSAAAAAVAPPAAAPVVAPVTPAAAPAPASPEAASPEAADSGSSEGTEAGSTSFEIPGNQTETMIIGDLNGSLQALRDNLLTLKAIEIGAHDKWTWIAGNRKLVLMGDTMGDRIAEGMPIRAKIEDLKEQAEAAGGLLVDIYGNHEDMKMAFITGRSLYGKTKGIKSLIDDLSVDYNPEGDSPDSYSPWQGKGVLELVAKYSEIGKRFGEDLEKLEAELHLYHGDTRLSEQGYIDLCNEVRKNMQTDTEGREFLESMCSMKLVDWDGSNVIFHTEPTKGILFKLTTGNDLSRTIDEINSEFQNNLRALLLNPTESMDEHPEFAMLSSLFCNPYNRDFKYSLTDPNATILLDKLYGLGARRIVHAHTPVVATDEREYSYVNGSVEIAICNVDYGYGHKGNFDSNVRSTAYLDRSLDMHMGKDEAEKIEKFNQQIAYIAGWFEVVIKENVNLNVNVDFAAVAKRVIEGLRLSFSDMTEVKSYFNNELRRFFELIMNNSLCGGDNEVDWSEKDDIFGLVALYKTAIGPVDGTFEEKITIMRGYKAKNLGELISLWIDNHTVNSSDADADAAVNGAEASSETPPDDTSSEASSVSDGSDDENADDEASEDDKGPGDGGEGTAGAGSSTPTATPDGASDSSDSSPEETSKVKTTPEAEPTSSAAIKTPDVSLVPKKKAPTVTTSAAIRASVMATTSAKATVAVEATTHAITLPVSEKTINAISDAEIEKLGQVHLSEIFDDNEEPVEDLLEKVKPGNYEKYLHYLKKILKYPHVFEFLFTLRRAGESIDTNGMRLKKVDLRSNNTRDLLKVLNTSDEKLAKVMEMLSKKGIAETLKAITSSKQKTLIKWFVKLS